MFQIALEVDAELSGIRQTFYDVIMQREVCIHIQSLLFVLVLFALCYGVEEFLILEHRVPFTVHSAHITVIQPQCPVGIIGRIDGQVFIVVATHIEKVVEIIGCREDGVQLDFLIHLEAKVRPQGETLLLVTDDG